MTDFTLDEVRVIKLATGEVIMGFQGTMYDELDENPELDNYIIIHNPYEVEYEVVEEESKQHGFVVNCYRWMPFLEDDALLIQKHNIIAIGMPDQDLLGVYANLLQIELLGGAHDCDEN